MCYWLVSTTGVKKINNSARRLDSFLPRNKTPNPGISPKKRGFVIQHIVIFFENTTQNHCASVAHQNFGFHPACVDRRSVGSFYSDGVFRNIHIQQHRAVGCNLRCYCQLQIGLLELGGCCTTAGGNLVRNFSTLLNQGRFFVRGNDAGDWTPCAPCFQFQAPEAAN